MTFCVPKSGSGVPPPNPMKAASYPPFAYVGGGQPFGQEKRLLSRTPKLTKTTLAAMLTDVSEFVMICAHCLLKGLDVGAMSVIENSACCGVDAAIAGSGKTEKTMTNVTTPKSAPFA